MGLPWDGEEDPAGSDATPLRPTKALETFGEETRTESNCLPPAPPDFPSEEEENLAEGFSGHALI